MVSLVSWDRIRSLTEREDFLPGAIAAAAILLFVATAGQTMGAFLEELSGSAAYARRSHTVSVLLNVALVLFAWRRHKEARAAMEEREAAEQRAQLLMCKDLDTELLNRQSFKDCGDEVIREADLLGTTAALFVINLHRFKRVNETHGHAAGDAVLKTIAGTILNTAPHRARCARLGADEFAILLPFAPANEGEVTALGDTLVESLALPIVVDHERIDVSVAIGIARLDLDCFNFSSLLRRADLAMNVAKAANSNDPVWFAPKMESAVRARNVVETGLRRGIPAGEFVPYYQPVVELRSGKIRGLEMLARWHHPDAGVVGPDVFIHVAEELGLIGLLSETLIRAAFEDARQWDPALTLSVNISPRQLMDPLLARKILKLIEDTDFPAKRLELEITESSLFEDLELAQSLVHTLKRHGIRIALDDFGTGYSSLSHLRALPFDRIKVDRSFIVSLTKDKESWAIVKTIATMGSTLGVPVTAEGVESGAIELRLRELDCDLGQGWFFGKPAPAEETLELLASHDLLSVPLQFAKARRIAARR